MFNRHDEQCMHERVPENTRQRERYTIVKDISARASTKLDNYINYVT